MSKKDGRRKGVCMGREKVSIIQLVIEKFEENSKRCQGYLVRKASAKLREKDIRRLDMSRLAEEAKRLEGLINIKWTSVDKVNIDSIQFTSIKNMEEIYRMCGKVPVWESMKQYSDRITYTLKHIEKDWIRQYLNDLLLGLQEEKTVSKELKSEEFFKVIDAIDKLKKPTLKRNFSVEVLNDSKAFKDKYQSFIISIAKKYHPTIKNEDNMTDDEILSQLYLEEHTQYFRFIGGLLLNIDGQTINTYDWKWGVTLNSKTMQFATLCSNQTIKKVVTIENEANFSNKEREDEVLYVLTHGYPSPKEQLFLKQLVEVLKENNATYYHTGDLDYGGLSIYRFIKREIIPQLQPLMMDKETFLHYKNKGAGKPMDDKMAMKIKQMDLSNCLELEPLRQCMVEEKWKIEQEYWV